MSRKPTKSPATARPETNETPAELSDAERKRGRPFKPGESGNPGGQSKEKRAFLDRLTGDDADTVYENFMALVKERNPPAVLRAVEYLAGRPAAAKEDNEALREGLTVVVQSLAERGRK